MRLLGHVRITTEIVVINGEPLSIEQHQSAENGQSALRGKTLLTYLYKKYVGDYPKFYKMDLLCRLGFVASELLLQQPEAGERFVEREDRAVVLFNRSGSVVADREFETTICPGENYFPSPADFVYTLPNIVTGEIAIRNGFRGETSFIVLAQKDEVQMQILLEQVFLDQDISSVLGGWVEAPSADELEADLYLYGR